MNRFLPFGSQYYRAPTPTPDKWEADLRQLRDAGFNTIKILAQWRWNNPREDVFDFSDLTGLMDLAKAYDLKVIINVFFDIAPAWFYQKYPDSLMKYADGRKLYPRQNGSRPVGGAPGPCYHHEDGLRLRLAFLEALVKTFADHPALYLWDLWNEPELTTAISREPSMQDMVCYCDHSVHLFRAWAMEKYGSIETLNRVWHRNYNDMTEIEAPRNPETFSDMIDWRLFFADTLTRELRHRIASVKKYDTTHPVMVHIVPMPCFNMVNACCDEYAMAEACDLFGNSIGSHPFAAAMTTSASPDKPVINAEIHAMGGNTFRRPMIPTFEDFQKHIFIPLARGVKGFVFWQYRPESIGFEAPAWGLTDARGQKTDWHGYAQIINNALQKHRDILCAASPEPSEAAVIGSSQNQIFDFCCTGGIDLTHRSLYGAYAMIYDNNDRADILQAESLTLPKLQRYKVVYYPFPYYMDKQMADLLRTYVAGGGLLITEALFAGFRGEDGTHSDAIPGYDMEDVFGASESRVVMASDSRALYNSYAADVSDFDPHQTVSITLTDPAFADIGPLRGGVYREELAPSSARVLAEFDGGAPAVTMSSCGEGTVVWIGSLLACAYHDNHEPSARQFLSRLFRARGVARVVTCSNEHIRLDRLTGGMKDVIILYNRTGETQTTSLSYAGGGEMSGLTNILDGLTHDAKNLSLGPEACEVFLTEPDLQAGGLPVY